ncbi:MAG: hydrolase or metal-binding protein [Rhodocyclaceae bacterium]|nr:MAG: hydrolase or metal-binding protein [Rhodocyclaceae bacterium]
MIKGLVLTPPVLGRISIGKVVERQGKRLPEKDDQFTLTTQLQGREGWLAHPLDGVLRKAQGGKIRTIPITLPFNDPDLNFRASYSLFDRTTGRPLCVGDGETCRRVTEAGVVTLDCPAPEGCPLAVGRQCKPYGRLNVVVSGDGLAGMEEMEGLKGIEDREGLVGEEDPWGTFVFRTTGFNSIRTLAARLRYFQAMSGDRLALLPLALRLRGKTTTQSRGTPIYYVDLTLRTRVTVEQALAQGREKQAIREAAGFDQGALDAAARLGMANGAFEESEEDGQAVVEEFFASGEGAVSEAVTKDAGLAGKLRAKVAAQGKRDAA